MTGGLLVQGFEGGASVSKRVSEWGTMQGEVGVWSTEPFYTVVPHALFRVAEILPVVVVVVVV